MAGFVCLGGGGGGGKSLNFDYVSASSYANLPSASTQKENTFGLITSVSIPDGGFSIRTKLSTSPVAGEVVALVGHDSTQIFEAIAGSGVYVYPVTVYQFQSGVWVCIETYLMQSAAWGIVKIYYYSDGLLAGYTWAGWANGAASHADGGSCLIASILVDSTSGAAGKYMAEVVDLSPYNTITLDYDFTHESEGTWGSYLYVNGAPTTSINAACPASAAHVALPTGSNVQAALDVSGLSGSYYIQTHIGKSSYFKTGSLVIHKLSIK